MSIKSLTLFLVTLLVADAALAGATGSAPNSTFADDQATRGLRTAESVEKTCLYESLHGGAQHDMAQTELAVIPSNGGGACGRLGIIGDCTCYISPYSTN
jgi:hypothetical protein